MGLKFSIKESEHCLITDFQKVRGDLLVVLGYFVSFCDKNSLECKVTNVVGKFPQSKSDTHPEGRAFDASLRGWNETKIKECMTFMDMACGQLGAVSARDGKRRVIVRHDAGLGDHFHFQVRR